MRAGIVNDVVLAGRKDTLLQCSIRLLAVVIEAGNAPVEHERLRAIRATADGAIHIIHDEIKPYAQGLNILVGYKHESEFASFGSRWNVLRTKF